MPKTTLKEWKKALEADKAMLEKFLEYEKKLKSGEEVENLTLKNCQSTIAKLKDVVKNKEMLFNKISNVKIAKDLLVVSKLIQNEH